MTVGKSLSRAANIVLKLFYVLFLQCQSIGVKDKIQAQQPGSPAALDMGAVAAFPDGGPTSPAVMDQQQQPIVMQPTTTDGVTVESIGTERMDIINHSG